MTRAAFLLVAGAIGLAGCSPTTTGAVVGGGAGAAIGAAATNSVAGAAVGGAIGAGVGAAIGSQYCTYYDAQGRPYTALCPQG
jgi:hypothetical protein